MQREMHYLFDQRFSAVLRQWRIALFAVPIIAALVVRALEREWIWHVVPIFDCVLGPQSLVFMKSDWVLLQMSEPCRDYQRL
jgi:hypothetical protein